MSGEVRRRRPGGRSAQVRLAVLAATLDVLSDRGATSFSIAEVAKRSGVHETSIYRRWGTRERLVVDAMSELSTALLPIHDTGSLRDDLVALGQALVKYVESPLGESLTRTMACSDDDEPAAVARAQFWSARYAECATIVDRAVDRQEVHSGTSARLLLEAFVAPIHFRLLLTREEVSTDALEVLADIAIKGATDSS
ncbi:MAG: TetR/AcrR family transcriptional regulator [Dermabacter sp.]|nr:TetR/AcrR family transcriptional regulator [Dermabacter sp.]